MVFSNWKLSTVLREPLVHFAVLTALLFFLEYAVFGEKKDVIVIDEQTSRYLIEQRESLVLRELTTEEQDQVIEAYIEDEILYKEAYKRGLDQGDSRIRRNLVLKMRGLLNGEVAEPTDSELRQHYIENQQSFVRPGVYRAQHLVFHDVKEIPSELIEQLEQGQDYSSLGDLIVPYQRDIPRISGDHLARFLELKRLDEIGVLSDGHWHGPLQSTRGAHFVRLEQIEPPRAMEFPEVRDYLSGSWAKINTRQAIEAEVSRLRQNYQIHIEARE